MSDIKAEVTKTTRSSGTRSRSRSRSETVSAEEVRPVSTTEDEGFASGIVDDGKANTEAIPAVSPPVPAVVPVIPSPAAVPQPPVHSETVAHEPPPAVHGPLTPPISQRIESPSIDPNEHGFDAETNSRYEEIKKGNTYITELQHMTIAQLQKAAKEEGVPREEYVGLKKQDLIFRILKERVKANGLMFGEGTLEVLPDGFGFCAQP